jgi:phosphoserine phosphatase
MKIFNPGMFDREMLEGQDIVFDMDGTLIEGDIGETLFYHTLLAASIYPSSTVTRIAPISEKELKKPVILSEEYAELLINYRTKISSQLFGEAYIKAAQWLEKYPRKDLEKLTYAFLTDHKAPKTIKCKAQINNTITYMKIPYGAHIRPVMREIVAYFIKCKVNLWIVSASPQTICEKVADELGIDRKRVIGVKVRVTEQEHPRLPWGANKLDALKEASVFQPLIVFGDGEGDLEMLAMAKYPVVVEDGSAKLVELAEKQGWLIYPC